MSRKLKSMTSFIAQVRERLNERRNRIASILEKGAKAVRGKPVAKSRRRAA